MTSGPEPSELLVELAGGEWPGEWVHFFKEFDGSMCPMPNLDVLHRIERLDETAREALVVELVERATRIDAERSPTAPGAEGERIRTQTIRLEQAYLEAAGR